MSTPSSSAAMVTSSSTTDVMSTVELISVVIEVLAEQRIAGYLLVDGEEITYLTSVPLKSWISQGERISQLESLMPPGRVNTM